MAEKVSPAEDTKVLKTLSSFTRDELVRFRNYILSSYLSNKGPLLEFLDELLPILSKGKTPSVAQLFKLLLKTAKLSRATYASLFKDLVRLAQDFIQNERYQDAPEQAVSDVLTAVNAKRLNKLFDINMSLARKLQSSVSGHSADFYLREFVISTEADLHKSLSSASKEKIAPAILMEQLDEFYIINKLRYSCEAKHFGRDNESAPDEIINLAASGRYDALPSVQVYAAIYRMLEDEEDEAQFEQLKALLKTHQKVLTDTILRDAFVFAINYCVKKVNQGRFSYLREVYDIYKMAIDRNFLYEGNELSAWDYSGIMALGVQLRDYDWSEKLIEVYKERVPTAGKKMNVVTFNMAKMYFFGGRYKDVLQLLSGVQSDDMMYVLGANALLIKTYYEMGDKDELYKHLAAFKINLRRRKKIDAAEKNSYLQFIEMATALSQLAKKDKKAMRDLKQTITNNTEVAEREWLLEKTT